jgi:hypothetical protein
LSARIFEAIHLRVMNHAAALNPLIMAAPDDLPVANKNRADRNAAFLETCACFLDCALEKWIDVEILARCGS